MELNEIPMRAYEDHGTSFDFYLTDCDFAQLAQLDNQTLTVTHASKILRVFEGLRTVSIEDNGDYFTYRAARKLDPDTESAIQELQNNLKIVDESQVNQVTTSTELQEQLEIQAQAIQELAEIISRMES